MKHCVMPAALAALLLLAASAHASAVEDSLAAMSDSARVALIFPFEVGQVYQFKASGDFTRPNGEVLPAYTVAEVTITDTVINDVTWLRIPYWSPFGTELYRLDQDGNVLQWQWRAIEWAETILLPLAAGEWPADCEGCLAHFGYTFSDGERFTQCGPTSAMIPFRLWGWTMHEPDSALCLQLSVQFQTHTWGIHSRHGATGPGTCMHGTGHSDWPLTETDVGYENDYTPAATWALFRPKSDEAWPEMDPVGTTDVDKSRLPSTSRASQVTLTAYPNPFNPSVVVCYSTSTAAAVGLHVYGLTGQVVCVLAEGQHSAGHHRAVWYGTDELGRRVGSGVYIVRLQTPDGTTSRRITLLR